ncbi:MAG: hypothetical protein EZS28_002029 [Streblomastix strix]|uniref:Uncharacterized protein n=1 Tax=Streblomastix strix TaxID=222440 RepID=A0A5J4X6Q9_9EUKA|nr:MAG: hypothetical protein EZS28_002029 [Streblomastix strix]
MYDKSSAFLVGFSRILNINDYEFHGTYVFDNYTNSTNTNESAPNEASNEAASDSFIDEFYFPEFLSETQVQSRNELATSKPIRIVYPTGLKIASIEQIWSWEKVAVVYFVKPLIRKREILVMANLRVLEQFKILYVLERLVQMKTALTYKTNTICLGHKHVNIDVKESCKICPKLLGFLNVVSYCLILILKDTLNAQNNQLSCRD